MSKRRARLSPEAEAAQFILSGGDKPCLTVQWINNYKGMLNGIPCGYCMNVSRAATNDCFNECTLFK